MHGKRNLGRWKNRRWLAWQQLFDGTPDYANAVESKRFSEPNSMPAMLTMDDDILSPHLSDNDIYIPLDIGDFESDDEDIEKRHASRWNYIHRKLAALDDASKRDTESYVDKRMNSRWLLIQNKLNELNNGADKRFAGRWRNQNWLLRKLVDDSETDLQNLDKRNLGRWKNRNWILRKFSSE